jgi:hypothetical protein
LPGENHTALAALKDAASTQQKSATPRSLAQEDKSPKEDGDTRTNGVTESKTERNADIALTSNRSKSRFPIFLHTSIILCAYCVHEQCFI